MSERKGRPQIELFGPKPDVPPYVRRSKTSRDAAISVIPVVRGIQAQLLDCIRKQGAHGITDDEMEQLLGLKHQTVSAQRRQLVKQGYIHDSGKTRPTRSGRRATVWVPNAQRATEVTDGVSNGERGD